MQNFQFLKDVNGVKRMRIVKKGYDANNLSLASNLVVFDSAAMSHLAVYSSGVAAATMAGTDIKIVAWQDPGYVPMTFIFCSTDANVWNSIVGYNAAEPRVNVARDGIYMSTGSFNIPVYVMYFSFRQPT